VIFLLRCVIIPFIIKNGAPKRSKDFRGTDRGRK
jgi:hypothetical protein